MYCYCYLLVVFVETETDANSKRQRDFILFWNVGKRDKQNDPDTTFIIAIPNTLFRSNSGHQTSHRSSQYSGSCMTLDSNTSATSSLGNWLEGIGLGHYRERLQQNGYMTLEHIVSMSRR